MKIPTHIHMVKDGFGNKAYAVAEDGYTILQIQGVKNAKEENLYFESDAHHLEGWCKLQGLEYKCVEYTHDFDKLWDKTTKA
jgi:hypothetical protein